MLEYVFIFAYFLGRSHSGTHLAISEDGLHFTPILEGAAILTPEQGLMRDPFLHYSEEEQQFHLLWTTEWESQTIGHATSKDLIHWSEQENLPVMHGIEGVRNCWAPEMVWDAETEQYLLFWASTVKGMFEQTAGTSEDAYNHRMWRTTTKDFKTFTPAEIFYDPGFSVIDSTMVIRDESYYLITKDERLIPEHKFLFVATADTPFGPWSDPGPAISISLVEGPGTLQWENKTRVFFDRYRQHEYGALESKDMKSWADISANISIPEGARHGSFVRIPKHLIEHLLSEN